MLNACVTIVICTVILHLQHAESTARVSTTVGTVEISKVFEVQRKCNVNCYRYRIILPLEAVFTEHSAWADFIPSRRHRNGWDSVRTESGFELGSPVS